MNYTDLPDDIIDTIETMRWKLEMKCVLDDIVEYSNGPRDDFCLNCIYHGCRCANCAIYVDNGLYGPGKFDNKCFFITDVDEYSSETFDNIQKWVNSHYPERCISITTRELHKLMDKPQNRVR